MIILLNRRIGHVFKVKRKQWAKKAGLKDYYCTILKNEFFPHIRCKYVTYIPNLFPRPLNYYCNLKPRVSYVGSFEEFGHLLFNQDHKLQLSQNTYNRFNTELTLKNYVDTIHAITPKI